MPTVKLISHARNVDRVFLLHIARTGTDLYLSNVDCTYNSIRWDRRIYEDVKMENSLGETFKPVLGPIRVKVACANHDAQLDTWHAAEDLRGLAADLTRVDMAPGGNTETVAGTIIGVTFGIEGQITLDLRPVVETYQPIVSRVGTSTFPSGIHSDRGIPWVWGNARHVPCPCINEDTALDNYDFVVAEGEVPTCDAVKRNGVTVAASEYTYYDGTQGSPYPGYAFLRFSVQQRDFSGNLYEITANVQGLSRNFATNIKSVIVDGLGLSANAANFTAAAAAIPAAVYCDGYDADPNRKAHDIINEMMFSCRGERLYKNTSGEWCLTIDASKSSSYSLGYGDGYYNNVFDIQSVTIAESAGLIQELNVNYRRKGSEYRVHNTRAGWTGIGEKRSYDIRYLWDHTAADYVTCYHVKKNIAGSEFVRMTCNDEIRGVEVGNVVTLTSPVHSISAATYEVIKRTESEAGIELTVRSYDTTPYTYSAGTLPTDEEYDTTDQAQAPAAPQIVSVDTGVATGTDGTALAYAEILAEAQDTLTKRVVFGVRRADTTNKWDTTRPFEYRTGDYNSSTDQWGFRADNLIPGAVYEFSARAISAFEIWDAEEAFGTFSAFRDTFLYNSAPTTNYGSLTYVRAQSYTAGANVTRAILQYLVSTLPSEAVKAVLRLYYYDNGGLDGVGQTLNLYRITQTWNETEATWNDRTTGVAWTDPGGTYDTTLIDSQVVPAGYGWMEFDVTEIVRDAKAGASSADFIVKFADESVGIYQVNFYSKTGTNPPELVCYSHEGRFTLPGDSTAPATVAGLSATYDNEGVKLAWTAATDADLKQYIIYRGTSANPTTELCRVLTNQYTDRTGTPGTTYHYRVKAIDFSGNVSASYSSSVSAVNQKITAASIAHSPTGTTGIFYQSSGSTVLASFGGDKNGTADGQTHWYTTGGTEIATIGKSTFGSDPVVGWFDGDAAGQKYGVIGQTGTSGGAGVAGLSTTSAGIGIWGKSGGVGVQGESSLNGAGVWGYTASSGAIGVKATNASTGLALQVTGRIGSDQHAANTSAGNKTHRIPYYDGSNNFVGYLWLLDS